MSRRAVVFARMLGAVAILAFALTACPNGEGPEVEFECEEHDECLEGEACLDEVCTDAPTEDQECPDEHEGEIYEHLRCVDGVWEPTEQPDAPMVQSVDAEPPTADPGGTIELSADVDYDNPDDLDWEWTAPTGWELVEDDEPVVDLTAHSDWGHTATIEVEVTDPYDQSDSGEVVTSTHALEGPEIEALDVEPNPTIPDMVQTAAVEVGHPLDLEIDNHDWSIPEDWEFEDDGEGPEIEIRTPDEYGVSGNVEVVVTDTKDQDVTASTGVSVVPEDNEPPEINELYLDDVPVQTEGSTQAHVEAEDPTSSDDPEFEWSIEGEDWELEVDEADDSIADIEAPAAYGDEAEITVVATGAYLETAEETVTARTKTEDNEAPVVEQLVVEQSELPPGQETGAEVQAYDPHGEDLDYSWTVGGDWTVEPTEGDPTVTVTAADEVGSEATVEVVVTDGDDETDDATATAELETITNPGPTITSVDPDETDDIGPGQQVDVTVDADHDAGFSLYYGWNLDNDDWQVVDGANQPTATVQAPEAPNSTVEVTAVVTDDYDGEDTSSATLETFENQPPIIDDAETGAEPEGPFELNEQFELFVDAESPDGDDAELTYQWETDGQWDIGDEESATTDAWAPDRTETEPVTITVTDEWNDSTTETVDVETYDYVVDDFGFEDVDEADPVSWVVSEKVELEGFDAPGAPASCSGCELKRHDEDGSTDWVDELGIGDGFEDGDEIEIRVESAIFEETVEASVQVGDTESETWSVTTKEAQPRELTTCGADGRTGPEQNDCDDEYDGPLSNEIEVEDGIQTWTVPAGGTYEIEAAGAQGTGPSDDDFEPGLGAEVLGEFEFEAGEQIVVVVGQQGEIANEEAGGGGGTFIAREDGGWEPIVVAGGGGGVYGDDDDFEINPDRHGQADESGGDGEGSREGGDGGTDGEEGELVTYQDNRWIFGGAGFMGSHDQDHSPDAFVEGAAGGDRNSSAPDGVADGGFGAGGSVTDNGDDCTGGACCGGGGGYSGGGAARSGVANVGWCSAGGGGSYNADDDGFELEGEQEGDGRVTIEWAE